MSFFPPIILYFIFIIFLFSFFFKSSKNFHGLVLPFCLCLDYTATLKFDGCRCSHIERFMRVCVCLSWLCLFWFIFRNEKCVVGIIIIDACTFQLARRRQWFVTKNNFFKFLPLFFYVRKKFPCFDFFNTNYVYPKMAASEEGIFEDFSIFFFFFVLFVPF